MLLSFDVGKITHLLLFVIHSFGGKVEMYRLFAILYFADLQHLLKYGRSITGDSYVAMKDCPVPFNVFSIYKQLAGDTFKGLDVGIKEFFALNTEGQIVAIGQYSSDMIAETEIECLFEVIHIYKNMHDDVLLAKMKDNAWQLSDKNGNISLHHLLHVSNVPEDVCTYIENAVRRDLHAFTEAGDIVQRKNNAHHNSLHSLSIGAIIRDYDNGRQNDFLIVGTSLNDYAMVGLVANDTLPVSLAGRVSFFPVTYSRGDISDSMLADCSRMITRRFGTMGAWIKKYPEAFVGQVSIATIGQVVRKISEARTISRHAKKSYSLSDHYVFFS